MFGGSSSTKPVCQFFLKGTCKYGTGCWNLHPQGQMGTSGGNVFGAASSTSSSLFGGNKSNTGQESKELQDFIKQVSGEMNQWERSGQWLLSSFTPLKTSGPIPGFVDTSPEELRIEAYNANKNNTFASYQSQWNELQNKHKQLREALKMSTPEAKEALKAVYNSKTNDGAQASQSNVFGSSTATSTPSVFGGSSSAASTTPSSSVFGASKVTSPAVFGGAPAFGATAASSSSSVFGQQKSTFGTGAAPNSLFGASNSNPFNKTPVTPSGASNNLFGSGTNTQSSSTPNPFGGQTQGGLFGNAPANKSNIFGGSGQTPSVFGKPAQPGTFGGNQTTNTLFGATPQPQTQSVFGGSSGTFGSTPSSATTTPATSSIFGSSGNSAFGAAAITQPSTTSIFGGSNTAQPQSSASVFGGTGAASTSTSVFGGAAANLSSTTTQSSVFGAAAAAPAAGTAATASIFGGGAASTPQTGGSVFGGASAATPQSTASSVFGGGAATNAGVFGSTPAVTIAPSPFGTSTSLSQTTQPANPFGNGAPAVSTEANKGDGTDVWYTPLDKLDAEDLKEFQAQSFTRVPLMPPPRNLCTIGA